VQISKQISRSLMGGGGEGWGSGVSGVHSWSQWSPPRGSVESVESEFKINTRTAARSNVHEAMFRAMMAPTTDTHVSQHRKSRPQLTGIISAYEQVHACVSVRTCVFSLIMCSNQPVLLHRSARTQFVRTMRSSNVSLSQNCTLRVQSRLLFRAVAKLRRRKSACLGRACAVPRSLGCL
jgi:hypothetical protein